MVILHCIKRSSTQTTSEIVTKVTQSPYVVNTSENIRNLLDMIQHSAVQEAQEVLTPYYVNKRVEVLAWLVLLDRTTSTANCWSALNYKVEGQSNASGLQQSKPLPLGAI